MLYIFNLFCWKGCPLQEDQHIWASVPSKNLNPPALKHKIKLLGRDKYRHKFTNPPLLSFSIMLTLSLLGHATCCRIFLPHFSLYSHTHTHLCSAAVSCALPLVLVVVEPAGEALVSESPEPNPSALTSRHSISGEHDLTKTKWQRERDSFTRHELFGNTQALQPLHYVCTVLLAAINKLQHCKSP